MSTDVVDSARFMCVAAAGAPPVLALLAAVIVLLAPTFRALLTYAVDRSRSHTRTLLAGLPHPRPPSLLVLSISRT